MASFICIHDTHQLSVEVKPGEYERIAFEDVTAVTVVELEKAPYRRFPLRWVVNEYLKELLYIMKGCLKRLGQTRNTFK